MPQNPASGSSGAVATRLGPRESHRACLPHRHSLYGHEGPPEPLRHAPSRDRTRLGRAPSRSGRRPPRRLRRGRRSHTSTHGRHPPSLRARDQLAPAMSVARDRRYRSRYTAIRASPVRERRRASSAKIPRHRPVACGRQYMHAAASFRSLFSLAGTLRRRPSVYPCYRRRRAVGRSVAVSRAVRTRLDGALQRSNFSDSSKP